MRLLVTGGRDYADRAHVWATLDAIHAAAPITVLVHGACPAGADRHAAEWATVRDVQQEPHPADWRRFGRAAGPVRNQEMADDGADVFVAFEGGTGTADMIRRAEAAGIRRWRAP